MRDMVFARSWQQRYGYAGDADRGIAARRLGQDIAQRQIRRRVVGSKPATRLAQHLARAQQFLARDIGMIAPDAATKKVAAFNPSSMWPKAAASAVLKLMMRPISTARRI